MKILRYIKIWSFCFLSLSWLACSDEISEEDGAQTVSQKTYAVSCKIGVRAVDDPNAEPAELLYQNLYLFFVNKSGMIEKKLVVLKDEFTSSSSFDRIVALTAGDKTVYGFANLSQDNDVFKQIMSLQEGAQFLIQTNQSCFLAADYDVETKGVPMSNYTSFTVLRTSGQQFSLELVRMFSKIRIRFKNRSGHKLQLNDFTITPVTQDAVYLFPSESAEPKFPHLPNQTGDQTFSLQSLQINDQQESEQKTLYLNESLVSTAGDWFQLKVGSSYLDDVDGSVHNEVRRMSLTQISSLKRNVLLDLPALILTDYHLDLTLNSYPPIGGYPAVVTMAEDGYHCHFSYGGHMTLTPVLSRLYDHSLVDNNLISWTCSCTGNLSIFKQIPIYDTASRCLMGELDNHQAGTALLTLTAQVLDSENIARLLTYRIYITKS